MRINRFKESHYPGIKDLISNYRYGRYCLDSNLSIDSARRYVIDQIIEYCAQDSNACWVVEEGMSIKGLLGMRKSEWDTEVFGFNAASLDYVVCEKSDYENEIFIKSKLLKKCNQWCQQEDISFVTARVDSLDLSTIHALEKCGFQYIETAVINSYDLRSNSDVEKSHHSVRLIRTDEIKEVADFTENAFPLHRFYADSRFPKRNVEKLYKKWVRDCHKKEECQIVVMDVDDKLGGFFLYSINDLTDYLGLKFAMWKLAALSAQIRGKGLGYELFLSTMDFLRGKVDIIDSGLTIQNVVSLNLHNKLGFQIISSTLTFHKWL